MGPVQVLVVTFAQPRMSGDALAELSRLGDRGIVRLIDVMLLERSADGRFETLPAPSGVESQLGPSAGSIAAAVLGEREQAHLLAAPTGNDPSWSLADSVPPGSVAAVALIEHVWATPLVDAIRAAGGQPVDEAWLAPQDVAVLEALIEQPDT
jgi:hypothetical protein